MDAADFRERLNRAKQGPPVEWKAKAADCVLQACRRAGRSPTDADLDLALDIAGRLAMEVAATNRDEQARAGLSQSAYSQATAREWLNLVRPFVEQARSMAFGGVEPPFAPERYDDAVAWIRDELERTPRPRPATDEGLLDLKKQLMRAQEAIIRYSGRQYPIGPDYFYLEYFDPERRRVAREELTTRPLSWYSMSERTAPLKVLAMACEEISGPTGFAKASILTYLLTGVEPDLPRARVKGSSTGLTLPDGKHVRGSRLLVEVLTPDLTVADLKELHANMGKMWRALGVGVARGAQAQRRRLTDLDAKLLQVVEGLGGAPDEPGAEWWEAVHEAWLAAGHGPKPTDPDSHRRRWARIQKKLDDPGVGPSVAQVEEL